MRSGGLRWGRLRTHALRLKFESLQRLQYTGSLQEGCATGGRRDFVKILVTGFEPFGKHTVNPSKEIILHLAKHAIPGVELVPAILPVHRAKTPELLLRAFDQARPEAVLSMGEAGGSSTPAVERVFVNLLEYSAELGEGVPAVDEPVSAGGAPAYFSTLPVREIHEEILKAGLPSRLSLSAGTYMCNQVGYVMQEHLGRRGLRIPAGFLHVPFLPEQSAQMAPTGPYASMSLDTLCRVATVAIETIAGKRGRIA
jgi:pyroglutamyl-peptidase